MARIKVEDIKPGMWCKVKRAEIKEGRGMFTSKLQSAVGVITHIPHHRLFAVVQFFSKDGKPLYKEAFHWIDIEKVMPGCKRKLTDKDRSVEDVDWSGQEDM